MPRDIAKALRKVYAENKKQNDIGLQVSLQGDINRFNAAYNKRKQDLKEGNFPVMELIDIYTWRTGDRSFIDSMRKTDNVIRTEPATIIIDAKLSWDGGLISGLRRVKSDCNNSGIRDTFTYLRPKLKIHNDWFICEKEFYTLSFKDLKPVYTKIKR